MKRSENCFAIQNKPGDEHSQGRRAHSHPPKDGRGIFGPAQKDANWLCSQAMRPQARGMRVDAGGIALLQTPNRPQHLRRQRNLPGKHRTAENAAAGWMGRAELHPEPDWRTGNAASGTRGARRSRAERGGISNPFFFLISACYSPDNACLYSTRKML